MQVTRHETARQNTPREKRKDNLFIVCGFSSLPVPSPFLFARLHLIVVGGGRVKRSLPKSVDLIPVQDREEMPFLLKF